MGRKAAMLFFVYASGCHWNAGNPVSPQPPVAPNACPMPVAHPTGDSDAEYVPELLDERVGCATWRPSEGDGRIMHFYRRDGEMVRTRSSRIPETLYAKLQNRLAFRKTAFPDLAERRVWIFCSILDEEKM